MPDRRTVGRFLRSRRSDPVVAAAMFVALLTEILGDAHAPSAVVGVLAAAALAAPFLWLRTRPDLATVAEAGLILALSTFVPAPARVGECAVAALTVYCGARASPRRIVVAVAALVVALQVSMGFSEFPNVEIAFVTILPAWIGRQIGRRSAITRALAARNRELQDEEARYVELSLQRERARIARELHDIVAHHLAVIVVQAGAGRIGQTAPELQARERFAVIGDAGYQALDEIGRLLLMLHVSDRPASDRDARWRKLADDARASGLSVQMSVRALDTELPDAITDQALRIVREGLTNAIKHAPGADVRVAVSRDDGWVSIDVRDSGPRGRSELSHSGSGLGLTGMRERVDELGGTLRAGPGADGGWWLQAALPVGAVHQRPVALER
jgi:signal transduction histidine kinase